MNYFILFYNEQNNESLKKVWHDLGNQLAGLGLIKLATIVGVVLLEVFRDLVVGVIVAEFFHESNSLAQALNSIN